jgi:hypothetical protein
MKVQTIRVLRRSLKILIWFGAGAVLLVAALAFLTQTQFFKDRLRSAIVASLADRFNGTFSLGTIRGNFLSGFSIDSLEITCNNQPVIRTGAVSFRYELLPLFEKKLHAHALHIDHPSVRLLRSADGEWNINKVIKPAPDTPATEFTWSGAFDTIDLRDGSLTVCDSLDLPPPGQSQGSFINYHRFSLTSIDLQFSAAVMKQFYEVRVHRARCTLAEPRFELRNFHGIFGYDANGLRISQLNIVTGKSDLDLDAFLHGRELLNNFSLNGLEHDSTRLILRAHKVDCGELTMFLPVLNFLQGQIALDLNTSGEFGNLALHKCDIGFSQTLLHISGSVKNLHNPGQLFLATTIGQSRIVPHDVRKLLPKFNLPPFDSVASTTVSGEFTGRPVDFAAKASIKGHFGSAEVHGTLNLTDSLPKYAAEVTTNALDLRAIFGASALSPSLTMKGNINGEGFDLRTMTATLSAAADSSFIRGLTVDRAELNINTADRQITTSLTLNTPESRADVNIRADISTPAAPLFSSEFSLTSVNLEPILQDARYSSDLTLRGSIEGSGSTIDDINTELTLSFLPSRFNGHEIRGEELRLSLNQRDIAHKHLSMTSSIADAEINGKFDLDLIVASLADQIPSLISTIRSHALPPDSVPPAKKHPLMTSHSPAQQMMDFTYEIHCKDLQPVTSLIDMQTFNTVADLNGAIQMTPDNLSLSCNGTIADLYLVTSSGGFALSGATLALTLDSLRKESTLDHLASSFSVHLASADIGKLHLEQSDARVTYNNGRGTFLMRGVCDSIYTLSLAGQTSIQPGTYVFDLDSLIAEIGPYRWINRQDIQCRLNNDGLRVMHAEMLHGNASVEASGILHLSGNVEGHLAMRRFNLQELNLWLPRNRIRSLSQHFLGTAAVDLTVGGSIGNPVLDLGVRCEHVAYRQTMIGMIEAALTYHDTLAHLDVTVRGEGDDSLSTLSLRGELPIDLTATEESSRFPARPQHLVLTSTRFDLGIFDPLIGEVDDLSGKLTANVVIGGTPGAPAFSGSMQLRDVNCIFTPNNVRYRLEGDLEPNGDKIYLKNFILRNNPAEGRQGEAQIRGSLAMKDYGISSFNITAFGQLLLMSEATRQTGISFSGILLTETDTAGLTMQGSFVQPVITGNLFVRDANLTFPPTYQNALSGSQLKVHHIVIDDTTNRRATHSTVRRLPWLGQQSDTSRQTQADHGNIFLDRLRYNVTVETKGTTAIRMIFSPEQGEELYAELEGKVSIINKEGTPTVYGDITILPHSYYNWYRRFDATGSLNFVGPWDNPELKIRAIYEAYHTVDSIAKSGGTNQQKVTVTLDITGKRYEPKMAMSMQVQLQPGDTPIDWSTQVRGGDVQSDAISFILFGKFNDEINSADRRSLTANFGSTASSGFTSTLLSGVLTNYLRKELPFIRDVGVTYQGGNPDVRITGDVLNGYLQFGGKILNNISNANVSYQVNLGDFLKNPSIRNLFLEIQHRDSDLTEERKTDEARIYYRFSF